MCIGAVTVAGVLAVVDVITAAEVEDAGHRTLEHPRPGRPEPHQRGFIVKVTVIGAPENGTVDHALPFIIEAAHCDG